jgi:hypothetical protein
MKNLTAAAILSIATVATGLSAQAGSLYFFDSPSGTSIHSTTDGYVGSTFNTPGGGFQLVTPDRGYVGSYTPAPSGGVFQSIWD